MLTRNPLHVIKSSSWTFVSREDVEWNLPHPRNPLKWALILSSVILNSDRVVVKPPTFTGVSKPNIWNVSSKRSLPLSITVILEASNEMEIPTSGESSIPAIMIVLTLVSDGVCLGDDSSSK